ncbi:MAG TPA: hypothetical protein VNW92_03215, partial [Polyangiaceae bacterium]|nr:hypothetical protein [Polyangiaceae bacterium]
MSYPPPGRHGSRPLVPVFVRVAAGKRSFIVFGDKQRRIAECDDDCAFWAWPGTYRVRLTQTEREPETSVRLRIRRSGNYELVVGDSTVRDAGLLLGVTGSAIALVGTVMMFAGALELGCTQDDAATSTQSDSCNTTPSVVYYGLVTFVVGA